MRICPNCSKQVADDYRFCSVCGFDFYGSGAGSVPIKAKKVKVQAPHEGKVKHIKTAPPIPPPQPEYIDHRTQAEEAYIRGDYYAALDNYKLALMNDPYNFDLIMARERLFEMLNHKDEAAECLEEALRLRPDDRELWSGKSRLLLLLYHEKGEQRYKKASDEATERAESLTTQLISKGLCPSCNSSGDCLKCLGRGICHECGGTGVYKGAVKCPFCDGTGMCDRCDGSGKCPDCHGTGRLEMLKCERCDGSGVCPKCQGKGKHLLGHCKECDGSGYCPVCKGKGKVINLPSPSEPSG
ncbi:MAG: hypothetical protein KAU14_04910 [Thermoplasmata archaeon]|nr:hypothetical protein [Thermoplasmata archaeon]